MSRLSTSAGTAPPAAHAAAVSSRPARWPQVYIELGKTRLSLMVVVTAAVGFLVAAPGPIDWPALAWLLAGTTLAAWAANALNQAMEMHRDALMHRTANRPLPSGRISLMHATLVGIVAAGAGLTILAAAANPLTGALGALTLATYLFIYTPLKTRTELNTLVGAVVGAIPPMMGWAAATGTLDTGAWVLAAVLFVWQIPHFLALAWMFRDDYRRGGYRMLPLADPTGVITGRAIVMWSLALIPVTLAATLFGVSGVLFAVGAVALGLWLTRLALVLARRPELDRARRVFFATVIYLPLLMALLIADRGLSGFATPDTPAPIATDAAAHSPTATAAAPLTPPVVAVDVEIAEP